MTAVLTFYTTQYTFGGGSVGLVALTTANAKSSLAFIPAVGLGIMCNALVCLAVWMCYSARTTIDRVVTIIPPIAAFVAVGFEHSIANVYFIPMGCDGIVGGKRPVEDAARDLPAIGHLAKGGCLVVEGILAVTVSTADRIATRGLPNPAWVNRSIAF
jgi:formate/nitrite transporter FocA (FNT family)